MTSRPRAFAVGRADAEDALAAPQPPDPEAVAW